VSKHFSGIIKFSSEDELEGEVSKHTLYRRTLRFKELMLGNTLETPGVMSWQTYATTA